jgi:class 3 adenylate cyclase
MDAATLVCAACSTDNRGGRRFCRACGSPLGAACPSCGAPNEPEDRFCGVCGTALGEAAGGPGSIGRAPTLGRSPGPASGHGPRGAGSGPTERRRVSVLFIDLVGFTPYAEERDPEAVRETLGRYFDLARERIERYGGSIEKFIGDAVMAVFGTPVGHEDDADRAVRAALDLVDAVAGLPTTTDGVSETLVARAAVMTGEAAVDPSAVGEGMVTGDLVNTASRLQGAAPPGGILVDEATKRATDASVAYEAAGAQVLKGKAEPIDAWRALRVVAGRGGARRASRLEAPFVGRDDELRLLKDLFHATERDRRARLVSVTGVGGIGKSRLAWELEKYLDGLAETVYWHAGRSPAYGDGLAFWALAEMIRGRAGIAEGDDATSVDRKLTETLQRWLPDPEERAWVEPRLAALLGSGEMPPGGTEELFAAWRTLFERIADQGPTILVFEDVHWADDGLLDFIERLVTNNRSRPVFIVTLARPELLEHRPTWGAGIRSFTSLELGPLDPEAMEMLLVGLAPGLPPTAIQAIRERAEGVPLYAVETVRMLVDQGRLTQTDGRYRLAGELGELAVPASLTTLLGARLDGLPEEERGLLGQAAVLGQTFTVDALASVAGLAPGDVSRILERLVSRELMLLDENPRSPERGQHGFVQGLLREVAYGRLSRRERVARHLAAVAYFERLADEDLTGVVATHLVDAHRSADGAEAEALAERARGALIAASKRAGELHAWRRAGGYLDEAAAIATDETQRMEILERLVTLGEATTGDLARLVATAREVVAWRSGGEDPAATAAAERRLGTLLLHQGRHTEARQVLSTAWGRVRGSSSPEALELGAELARSHMMAGDPAAATPVIEEVLPMAEATGAQGVIAEILATKAWALTASGRVVEAIALLRGNLIQTERHGPLRARLRSCMNLSSHLTGIDPREAFDVAREGYEIARRLGYTEWSLSLAGNAAECAFDLGEWSWIEAVVGTIDPEESVQALFGGAALAFGSHVEAFRGRQREAETLLQQALAASGDTEDPQVLAVRLQARLQSALATGDLAQGGTAIAEFLALDPRQLADQDRALMTAARLSVLRGRPGEVRDRIDGLATASRLAVATTDAARIAHALALLDLVAGGDPARSVERMDAAAGVFRAYGVRFQLAYARLDRAVFAPSLPGAEEAAAEARSILEELGAVTLLERLDAVHPAAAIIAPGRVRTEDPAQV